jgi:hypothetical protein
MIGVTEEDEVCRLVWGRAVSKEEADRGKSSLTCGTEKAEEAEEEEEEEEEEAEEVEEEEEETVAFEVEEEVLDFALFLTTPTFFFLLPSLFKTTVDILLSRVDFTRRGSKTRGAFGRLLELAPISFLLRASFSLENNARIESDRIFQERDTAN